MILVFYLPYRDELITIEYDHYLPGLIVNDLVSGYLMRDHQFEDVACAWNMVFVGTL